MREVPGAVIFDMDGLMLDTEPLSLRAWGHAASHFEVDFDPALGRRMIGRNGVACRELLAAHYGPSFPVAKLMDAWHAAYRAITDSEVVAVKPGLMELLDFLDERRIPKAVATSTGRLSAQSKLQRASLLDRFSILVGGDEVRHGKPAPDIFLEAAARLGVAADTCVVLEDSEPGVNAAWSAGMLPIMIPDLHPPSGELIERGLRVMASLHDVHARLKLVASGPPAS